VTTLYWFLLPLWAAFWASILIWFQRWLPKYLKTPTVADAINDMYDHLSAQIDGIIARVDEDKFRPLRESVGKGAVLTESELDDAIIAKLDSIIVKLDAMIEDNDE
jgi:hypothetical protein